MSAFEHKIDGVLIHSRDEVIAATMRLDRYTSEGWVVLSTTPIAAVGGKAQLITVFQRELKPTPTEKPHAPSKQSPSVRDSGPAA